MIDIAIDGITELIFKDHQQDNNDMVISIRKRDENAMKKRRIDSAKQPEDKYKA